MRGDKEQLSGNVEAVGLLLLLVAAGWELFIENSLYGDRMDAMLTAINGKLDRIWDVLKVTNMDSFAKQLDGGFRSSDWQLTHDWGVGLTQKIRFVMFAFGSLLVVVSKFIAANSK